MSSPPPRDAELGRFVDSDVLGSRAACSGHVENTEYNAIDVLDSLIQEYLLRSIAGLDEDTLRSELQTALESESEPAGNVDYTLRLDAACVDRAGCPSRRDQWFALARASRQRACSCVPMSFRSHRVCGRGSHLCPSYSWHRRRLALIRWWRKDSALGRTQTVCHTDSRFHFERGEKNVAGHCPGGGPNGLPHPPPHRRMLQGVAATVIRGHGRRGGSTQELGYTVAPASKVTLTQLNRWRTTEARTSPE